MIISFLLIPLRREWPLKQGQMEPSSSDFMALSQFIGCHFGCLCLEVRWLWPAKRKQKIKLVLRTLLKLLELIIKYKSMWQRVHQTSRVSWHVHVLRSTQNITRKKDQTKNWVWFHSPQRDGCLPGNIWPGRPHTESVKPFNRNDGGVTTTRGGACHHQEGVKWACFKTSQTTLLECNKPSVWTSAKVLPETVSATQVRFLRVVFSLCIGLHHRAENSLCLCVNDHFPHARTHQWVKWTRTNQLQHKHTC